MDVTSAFKNELFRPLTTVAIPGALSVGPYVLIAQHYAPAIRDFGDDHGGAFALAVIVCVLAAGLILEDFGSLLETKIDERHYTAHPEDKKDWEAYLALRLKDEVIGQRYLRTVLVRFKFELSMVPALFALTIGLIWIQGIFHVWNCTGIVLLCAFVLTLCWYMYSEAVTSAATLHRVRKAILAAPKHGAGLTIPD